MFTFKSLSLCLSRSLILILNSSTKWSKQLTSFLLILTSCLSLESSVHPPSSLTAIHQFASPMSTLLSGSASNGVTRAVTCGQDGQPIGGSRMLPSTKTIITGLVSPHRTRSNHCPTTAAALLSISLSPILEV